MNKNIIITLIYIIALVVTISAMIAGLNNETYLTGVTAIDNYTETTANWNVTSGTVTQITDSVIGEHSIQFNIPSGGYQQIRLTFPTPLNTSGTDRLSFWTKRVSKNGNYIYLKIVGTDDLNYFIINNPSIEDKSSWEINEALKTYFTPVGSPNWENITYIEFNESSSPPSHIWNIDGLDFYDETPSLGTLTSWNGVWINIIIAIFVVLIVLTAVLYSFGIIK